MCFGYRFRHPCTVQALTQQRITLLGSAPPSVPLLPVSALASYTWLWHAECTVGDSIAACASAATLHKADMGYTRGIRVGYMRPAPYLT